MMGDVKRNLEEPGQELGDVTITLDRLMWSEFKRMTRERGLSASVTLRDHIKREVYRMKREEARG